MISIRKLSIGTGILLILFLLSGCSSRPFLTKEDSYSIINVSPQGDIQKIPIELTWNSNAAVMQEFLLEATFVLSDLHTQISEEIESAKDNIINSTEVDSLGTDSTGTDSPVIDSSGADSTGVEKLEERHHESVENKTPNTKSKSSNNEKQANTEPGADSLTKTILLEANFPRAKKFNLTIDNEKFDLDVSSIQIEVIGKRPGRVILNQVLTLQGIPNPNLKTAYEQYIDMLKKIKREAK